MFRPSRCFILRPFNRVIRPLSKFGVVVFLLTVQFSALLQPNRTRIHTHAHAHIRGEQQDSVSKKYMRIVFIAKGSTQDNCSRYVQSTGHSHSHRIGRSGVQKTVAVDTLSLHLTPYQLPFHCTREWWAAHGGNRHSQFTPNVTFTIISLYSRVTDKRLRPKTRPVYILHHAPYHVTEQQSDVKKTVAVDTPCLYPRPHLFSYL